MSRVRANLSCIVLHPLGLLPLLLIQQKHQRALICPHGDCARRRRLDQANAKPPVEAAHALSLQNLRHCAHDTLIGGRFAAVGVQRPRGTLDLQALADEVEREDGSFGEDAGGDADDGIGRAKGQRDRSRHRMQRLVEGEEDAHVGHDLDDGGGEAAEETARSLVAYDGAHRGSEAVVDAEFALSSESGAQEIERIGEARACSAGSRAGDKRLGGLRERER